MKDGREVRARDHYLIVNCIMEYRARRHVGENLLEIGDMDHIARGTKTATSHAR